MGSRGTISLIDGVRPARALMEITYDDAMRYELDCPRGYFKLMYGKANLSASKSDKQWQKIETVNIFKGPVLTVGNTSNPTIGYHAGVCTKWTPPGLDLDDPIYK